jgi:hypothetical protein
MLAGCPLVNGAGFDCPTGDSCSDLTDRDSKSSRAIDLRATVRPYCLYLMAGLARLLGFGLDQGKALRFLDSPQRAGLPSCVPSCFERPDTSAEHAGVAAEFELKPPER